MHDLSLGVKAASDAFGSQAALARALGIKPSAISQWDRVPVNDKHNRVLEIEHLSDGRVTRHDMRPDIFGPPPKKRRAA